MVKKAVSPEIRAEVIGITVTALLMLGFMGTSIQSVFAAGGAGTLDSNGLLRLNPLGNNSPFGDSYSLSYDSEYYIGDARKNFRSDGSMRIDWVGKPNPMTDTDGVFLAGYFNIDLGGERTTANDCTANPSEEISMKMNGGPHSSDHPTWADTMDSGTISFNGDRSRFRTEATHPDYSGSYSGKSLSGGWPIQSVDLCAVPGGWVGAAAFKINIDKTGDGKADAVRILHYVDESGLLNGKPQNKWELVYYQEFAVPNGMALKSMPIPYVCTIGHCDVHQETIRIDGQSQSRWQSTTNPPYKFVTYKEIVVDGVGSPSPDPEPQPEPTPSTLTISFANVNEGQTLSKDYQIVVTASDTSKVSNIKLYVDSTLIKQENTTPYEFLTHTADFSDGTHTLKAVATDTSGNTVTKTISVKFDNSASQPEPTPTPTGSAITIDFANVKEGQTLSNNYEVVVTSSSPSDTENIKLYVDSTFIKTENTTPYEFDVDTGDFSDGSHVLKAVALDDTGHTVTKTVTANFNN